MTAVPKPTPEQVARDGRAWAWAARQLGDEDAAAIARRVRTLASELAEARSQDPDVLLPRGAVSRLGLTEMAPREALRELDRREAGTTPLPQTIAQHDAARQELLERLAILEEWADVDPAPLCLPVTATDPAMATDSVSPDLAQDAPSPDTPALVAQDPEPTPTTGPRAVPSGLKLRGVATDSGTTTPPPWTHAARPRAATRSLRRRVARRAIDLTRRLVRRP